MGDAPFLDRFRMTMSRFRTRSGVAAAGLVVVARIGGDVAHADAAAPQRAPGEGRRGVDGHDPNALSPLAVV
jgi:hypothetical protein